MLYSKLALTALAVTVAGAGAVGFGAYRAHAHGGFGGRHEMVAKFVDFVVNQKLDEIQATPAQRKKVLELKEHLMAQGRELHDEKGDVHQRMLALLSEDTLDAEQVRGLVRERTDAITRFADSATDAVIELHATLSPEQRQKLLAGLREHMAERGR